MKHGNLSQTDQNQTKKEPDEVVSEELLFLLRIWWTSEKKIAGSLVIQRTVISPAWFLIFIKIYELEESIYPWRP